VKKVELVFNPVSGKGRSAAAAKVAAAVIERAGVKTIVRKTERSGDAARFADRLSADTDAIVAVGGDGTLNEVVSGLRRDVPIGLVPVGTANVVARDLKIPFDATAAAKLVVEGTPRPLDVGRIGHRRFVAMVGVGFDGAIVKAVADARNGPITQMAYVAPSIRTLIDHAPKPLRLIVDDAPIEGPFFGVLVCNTRGYGGHFSVTPDAAIDDGLFHYVAWRKGERRHLLRYAVAALLRRKSGAAAYGAGRRFRIESLNGREVEAQADGDPLGRTPIEIEMLPSAARIFAPTAR
jgi:diacylglycerol kinase (ATP)